MDKLLNFIIDSIDEGIISTKITGEYLFWNASAKKILGEDQSNLPPEKWPAAYGFFHLDKKTLFKTDELPLVRALRGEYVKNCLIYIKNESVNGTYFETYAKPLYVAGELFGGVIIFKDVSWAYNLQDNLSRLKEQLLHLLGELEKTETTESQKVTE